MVSWAPNLTSCLL